MIPKEKMLDILEGYVPDELKSQYEAIRMRQPIRLSKPYYGVMNVGEYEWITNFSTDNPREAGLQFPSPQHLLLTAFDKNGKQLSGLVAVYRLKSHQ